MWPAAQMLADYIADNAKLIDGCSCACELGAGLGLVGLFAAQACPVIMTDHNDVVLRVMSKNAVMNQAGHSIRSAKLADKHCLHVACVETDCAMCTMQGESPCGTCRIYNPLYAHKECPALPRLKELTMTLNPPPPLPPMLGTTTLTLLCNGCMFSEH